MSTPANSRSRLNRRAWMGIAAGSLAAGLWPLAGQADDGEGGGEGGVPPLIPLANTGVRYKQVVVVGGGMAGMTAAKYLRLWGGTGVRVTLVEPDASYTSSIMSNLVLTGSRSLASLRFTHDELRSRYGVIRRAGSVVAIDAARRSIILSDGAELPYDRLVLAPGVSFDDAYGLVQDDYDTRTPHAWRGGPQTTLLRDQIAAMRNGETFVMSIPKSPYRCPPGPYERACVVADKLKRSGRASSRVIVLDENLSIQAERHTFEKAFNQIHAGVISYVPGVTGIQIDPGNRQVHYVDQIDGSTVLQAAVINPIVPHRATGSAAGGWLAQAGLNNSPDGRWAVVDVLSYASTAPGASDIHVIGDASSCGLPKAGHVANQEAKICADAIVRAFMGQAPDPQPVANSACYSPITATTASWLTAVYQYDAVERRMRVAASGGQTIINGQPAAATEAASINGDNFEDMGIWFRTLMQDTAS